MLATTKTDVLKRINFIEGHLNGIRRMVEGDQYYLGCATSRTGAAGAVPRGAAQGPPAKPPGGGGGGPASACPTPAAAPARGPPPPPRPPAGATWPESIHPRRCWKPPAARPRR